MKLGTEAAACMDGHENSLSTAKSHYMTGENVIAKEKNCSLPCWSYFECFPAPGSDKDYQLVCYLSCKPILSQKTNIGD